MKKATLISKWLQQDTLIKISLGYGWILSVYSLIKKNKSAKQKKTHNFREQNFFLNIQISDAPDSDTSLPFPELDTQQLFRSSNMVPKLV